MLDTVFTLAALIGGTVLVFQFVLMLLGFTDHGGDLAGPDGTHLGGDLLGGHDFPAGHDLSAGHDMSHAATSGAAVSVGDVAGGHPAWHEAADADLGHPGAHWFYEILSLRTLSAAITFFGLAGNTALAYGYSPIGSFVLATLVGLAAMYIVYWLFVQVYKLQHTGTENIRNAIGAPAVVYVPIPGKRAGSGKVTFRLQNRHVEYLAVTDDENRLATGEKVVVIAIVNNDTLRVARVAAPVPDRIPSSTTA
jgi:hypothetical protein